MNRDDYAVLYAAGALALVVALGSVAFFHLEEWDAVESLYFTVYTVTTVGFGDLAPSPENRLFTACFILVCTTLVLACIAAIGNWIVARIQRRSAGARVLESGDVAREVLSRLGGASDEATSELRRLEAEMLDALRRF